MNFVETMTEKLNTVWYSGKISAEEGAVLYAIWQAWGENKKITQQQIADSERFIGCHPKYEADIVAKKRDSTLRQVRQLIRNLRIIHGVPILSDARGYWIPYSIDEASEYLGRTEAIAKAQAAAWFETYRAMRDTLGITSSFFERLHPANASDQELVTMADSENTKRLQWEKDRAERNDRIRGMYGD